MQIKIFVCNPFQVNTYLLFDESKEAIVIDPAMMDQHEKSAFDAFIKDNDLKLVAVYNTHGHMDHIAGSSWIHERYNLSPKGHQADDMLIETAQAHAQSFGFTIEKPMPVSDYLNDKDSISFGAQNIEVRHTPGHSPGGLVYIHHETKSVFCGDSLFASSIGRTDLPGGDYDQLISSIKEKILVLEGNYKVYPGHGPSSNVGFEEENNPFLR